MIRSEEDKISRLSITLDQKIYEKVEESPKALQYEAAIIKEKRVAVCNEDAQELSYMQELMKKRGLVVDSVLDGNEIINKIKSGNQYGLIILDGDANTPSALTILQTIKQENKKKCPVIIVIDDKNEYLKKHFLQDGFKEVILKSQIKKELPEVLNKYLVV